MISQFGNSFRTGHRFGSVTAAVAVTAPVVTTAAAVMGAVAVTPAVEVTTLVSFGDCRSMARQRTM
jgi:hypothetical protein